MEPIRKAIYLLPAGHWLPNCYHLNIAKLDTIKKNIISEKKIKNLKVQCVRFSRAYCYKRVLQVMLIAVDATSSDIFVAGAAVLKLTKLQASSVADALHSAYY